MSWTLYKDLLCSADGTLDIGKTATRWKAIWGDTITGATITDGVASFTSGAGTGITAITMSGRLTNTYNSGSPFVITNATVNTNLNADLLDGLHGADYVAYDLGQLIYVQPGDTIQATINAIDDESASKIYTVMVPTGVYNEKVTMAPYINLVGMDRDGSIIKPSTISDNNIIITGCSNSMIANLSVICSTYVGTPGAPSGEYHGIRLTSVASSKVLNVFIDISAASDNVNYALDIVGGAPVIMGIESDGYVHMIDDGSAVSPTPVMTGCHFGNAEIQDLTKSAKISYCIFDRMATIQTLTNYAEIDYCSIHSISNIGGEVIFNHCEFVEHNTGNVAINVMMSNSTTIFRNCTFRALDTFPVDVYTGHGRFENCTFSGGTNSIAAYIYHHTSDYGGNIEFYNCTLLKDGSATYAMDGDGSNAPVIIQNCYLNAPISATIIQAAGNSYRVEENLTIGGNIIATTPLTINTTVDSSDDGQDIEISTDSPTAQGSAGSISIIVGDAVGGGVETSEQGGDIIITAGSSNGANGAGGSIYLTPGNNSGYMGTPGNPGQLYLRGSQGGSGGGAGAVNLDQVNAMGQNYTQLKFTGTLDNLFSGKIFRGIFFDYTNANHTCIAGINYFHAIDIDTIVADAQCEEYAININTGWDRAINILGGDIITAGNIDVDGTIQTDDLIVDASGIFQNISTLSITASGNLTIGNTTLTEQNLIDLLALL